MLFGVAFCLGAEFEVDVGVVLYVVWVLNSVVFLCFDFVVAVGVRVRFGIAFGVDAGLNFDVGCDAGADFCASVEIDVACDLFFAVGFGAEY